MLKKGADASKKGVIDIENDLSSQTGDRIKVLRHIGNDRDREAIDAAINWLRTSTDEPLDVVIELRRRGGTCSVLVTFVFRNDDGEPFHVPGGHCMLTISESGEIVDVMKGGVKWGEQKRHTFACAHGLSVHLRNRPDIRNRVHQEQGTKPQE